MQPHDLTRLTLAAGPAMLAGATAVAAGKSAPAAGSVDKAFEALKTYDWGTDRKSLNPIDDAVAATYGDLAAQAGIGNPAGGGAQERCVPRGEGLCLPRAEDDRHG